MKTKQQQISECSPKKKSYNPPTIQKIRLDNEISMIMMSLPPTEFPNEIPLMTNKRFRLIR